MDADFNLLRFFLAVAKEQNFRAAADHLGVTRSAVSQGIRRLEDSLGIALVQRSTRNVRLTEAGELLHRQIAGPLCAVGAALEEAAVEGPARGLLRVAVTSIAERFLSGPLISSFAEAHPGVTLDVTVTDDESDIVGAGFDAGVRLGEVIEQDMVAAPPTGAQPQRVGAPHPGLKRWPLPAPCPARTVGLLSLRGAARAPLADALAQLMREPA